jgi:hypothetical protein
MRKSVAPEQIARAIFVLQGQRVQLNAELAAGSSERVAKCDRSQKHHVAETSSLRLQFATLKTGRVRNLDVCT